MKYIRQAIRGIDKDLHDQVVALSNELSQPSHNVTITLWQG